MWPIFATVGVSPIRRRHPRCHWFPQDRCGSYPDPQTSSRGVLSDHRPAAKPRATLCSLDAFEITLAIVSPMVASFSRAARRQRKQQHERTE
jgi:hypothetical protein